MAADVVGERPVQLVHAGEIGGGIQPLAPYQPLEVDQLANLRALPGLIQRDGFEGERAALTRRAAQKIVEGTQRLLVLGALEQRKDMAGLADLEQAIEEAGLEADRAIVGGERVVERLHA